MRPTSSIGSCAVAAVACCALAAGPASAALPEFIPGAGVHFVAKSGKTILETVSKNKLTCHADNGEGEIVAPKTLTVKLVLTGCQNKKVPCNTVGRGAGEVVLSADGTLGYVVNPEVKEVGLDLATPTGAPLMEFVCGPALRGFVSGSVIGKITPVNTFVKPPKHFTLLFKQAGGHEAITHLFGEPVDVPFTSFGGPSEESGLASKDMLGFAAPVDIAA